MGFDALIAQYGHWTVKQQQKSCQYLVDYGLWKAVK
jgi:hypothetical protein